MGFDIIFPHCINRHYDANIYDMVDKYVNHGDKVVLSGQAICDQAKKVV